MDKIVSRALVNMREGSKTLKPTIIGNMVVAGHYGLVMTNDSAALNLTALLTESDQVWNDNVADYGSLVRKVYHGKMELVYDREKEQESDVT